MFSGEMSDYSQFSWVGAMAVSTAVLGAVAWKATTGVRVNTNFTGTSLQARSLNGEGDVKVSGDKAGGSVDLLPAIKARRSVFARNYVDREIDESVVKKLLEAAMWAPYHGPVPPWRFVVLGRKSMVEMQRMTLAFYDENWRDVSWAGGRTGPGAEEYFLKWRAKAESDITERWGPVSYMIAIVWSLAYYFLQLLCVYVKRRCKPKKL